MVLGLQQLELVLDAVAGVGGRELQLLRQVRGALEREETALGAGQELPRARPGPAAPDGAASLGTGAAPGTGRPGPAAPRGP